MSISIILLLLIIVVLFENISTFHLPNGLIYNGTIFKSEDYPYVMYLRIFYTPVMKDYTKCTGTLVKKMFILTAAHCCHEKNKSLIHVYQGSPKVNPKIHKVVKMTQHPDYDPIKYPFGPRGDICVLQLEKAFPNIKTFSKIGGSPKDFKKGKLNCTMIGFGQTGDKTTSGESGYIMTNNVAYGPTACKLHETEEIQNSWEQYLCLEPNGYATPCRGDSGGPMICNGMQYGVCSYGYSYTNGPEECGSPGQQEIYSFINAHKRWLNNIIEPKKNKKKKKRSSGNFLKLHPTCMHIILLILLYNIMLTFI
ncbi:mast cell protease 1-like [Acyrthosiphon pisum]|uniref:Peptidase S1 domain-containing protein n=1 Tax=Acyrthosiphon pisum TaxID=7029 RepID=A0A8R2D2N2_ACYPI|nr:mast cell protease 1-like [Acyrthosiphon pisum]|eukprot:XP_016657791.1 PREDICTED: mast cell protease 1-like [Acyrthosiphon pisum]